MHQIRSAPRGSAPDPAGGAYDAPQTPSQMGRGNLCAVFTGVPTKTEDSFVSANFPDIIYCSLCGMLRPVVLEIFT